MNVANFVYHLRAFILCYHLDYLLHDITPEEEAMHVGFTPRKMLILRAGQIKSVIKTQDSTNANLSEYSNVFDYKQLQIRMMGTFVCIMVQPILMVGHVATSLTLKRCFYIS